MSRHVLEVYGVHVVVLVNLVKVRGGKVGVDVRLPVVQGEALLEGGEEVVYVVLLGRPRFLLFVPLSLAMLDGGAPLLSTVGRISTVLGLLPRRHGVVGWWGRRRVVKSSFLGVYRCESIDLACNLASCGPCPWFFC